LVKALARAWQWQRVLDEGVYATVSEIGDAENISRATSRARPRPRPDGPRYMDRLVRAAVGVAALTVSSSATLSPIELVGVVVPR
jgi:hypothetical protein